MKEHPFIKSRYKYDIYNPVMWKKHPNNLYALTLCFKLDPESLINPPDARVYFVFFEEHPFDKIQVVSILLKKDFKDLVECILKWLSEKVKKYYEDNQGHYDVLEYVL
jgi:hypothetical protein